MVDLKVKIELQDTVEDKLKQIGSSSEINNASTLKTSDIFNKVSTKNDGINMKSWATGSLSLKDGFVGGKDTKLINQNGYNGYVFGNVPKNKKLEIKLNFYGENIDGIIIYGDKNANQFPTKAYLDNNSNKFIYNDDFSWAIRFDNASTSHSITLLEWNRENYNACIPYVSIIKNNLLLGKSYIKDVETLSQSSSQPSEIYYGVIPNNGNIELLDIDGELKDYITDGIIDNNETKIILINGDKNIQEHISNDADYFDESKTLKFELSNSLENWNKIIFNGMKYNNKNKNMFTILCEVFQTLGYNENQVTNMLNNYTFDKNNNYVKIVDYLKGIDIQYPYFEKSNFREVIDSICEMAQLNVIENDDGQIVFISARPVMDMKYKDIIVIPQGKQIKQFNSAVIVKNKINKVEIEKNNFYYENEQFGDVHNITLNSYDSDDGSWTNKFGVIPKKYKPSTKTYFFENGDQAYAINLSIEFNSNDIYCKNFKVQYNSTIYKSDRNGYTLEKRNSDAYKIIDLPEVEGTADVFPDFDNDYTPKIFLEYNDNRSKVIIHLITWYGGAFGKIDNYNARNYMKLGNLQVLLTCDKVKINSSKKSYGNGNNKFEIIPKQYMIQDDVVSDMIANNILSDYSNGIHTAKTTIVCSDFYDTNGNKIIDWSKNEIIKVNDIVRIDKDNNGNSISYYIDNSPMLWKVVGRRFRKKGVPLVDLELQEIKQTY